jgi:NAD(P)-dependent dehydrogenase (short-subunit alcohol dehydrogenase family)
MTKVNARDFAPHKIRINCISPGFVNTPMLSSSGLSEEFLAMAEAQSPMNRMTLAEEVAEATVFLVSGSASGITGSNLLVDAGANLFHIV